MGKLIEVIFTCGEDSFKVAIISKVGGNGVFETFKFTT
jgi:hypothetical protein